MKRYLKRIILVVPVLLVLLVPVSVLADQAYHSERLDLTLTANGDANGHPALRHGQVVNIHPNGPVNGALERYMVSGAMSDTSYNVRIEVFLPGCLVSAGDPIDIPGVLETNGRGVGQHQGFFSTEALIPFSGATLGVIWNLEAGGVDAYATECTTVVID
jgi:hypothetical protein